jgi:hypothetical protein
MEPTNTPGKPESSRADFGNLPESITLHGVTYTISKPVNSSGSANGTTGHSDTSVATLQGQEGGKMEATQGLPAVIGKAKALKANTPTIITKIDKVELVGPDQHKTPEVRTALQEFVDYRIRIKHPATVRALNMILKEFVNDSPKTLIEALEYTMASETGNPNSKKGNWIQVVRPKNSTSSGGQPRDLHAEMEELLSMEG